MVRRMTADAIARLREENRFALNVEEQHLLDHGGSGYIWETEINRLFRTIKLLEIGAGTTEVRKMIIAGELLG